MSYCSRVRSPAAYRRLTMSSAESRPGRAAVAAGPPGARRAGGSAVRPRPVADLGRVLAPPPDVRLVLDQPVAERLLGVRGDVAERGHPVDDVHRQVVAVHVVAYHHVERRSRGALL